MKLFDTARQQLIDFDPGPIVNMYTCGITPYDAAHIGHAATYLYYDIVQRRLRDLGHDVRCVRNITDVDDDMLRKAKELGVGYLQLADEQVARFDNAMTTLGLLPVLSAPRASSAIVEIVEMTTTLLSRGFAYEIDGNVYFERQLFDGFGKISGLSESEMLRLSAERGGNVYDRNKRDPLDFVLWQKSTEGEPAWKSPWSMGRPGWHIECSALALRELSTSTIDLHGGGADLVYPHHECEVAQCETFTGSQFVRHWMHVAMVTYQGEKMSKSLGNLVFVEKLLEKFDPRAIRLAILSNHYRQSWQWKDELCGLAQARLEVWINANNRGLGANAQSLGDQVRDCLDNDLDTPGAIRAIDIAASQGLSIIDSAALLGVWL